MTGLVCSDDRSMEPPKIEKVHQLIDYCHKADRFSGHGCDCGLIEAWRPYLMHLLKTPIHRYTSRQIICNEAIISLSSLKLYLDRTSTLHEEFAKAT